MTPNPISTALDRIDAEPSDEFVRALRSRLLDEYLHADSSTTADLSVTPPAGEPRKGRRLLMAAAVIVLVATGVLVARAVDRNTTTIRTGTVDVTTATTAESATSLPVSSTQPGGVTSAAPTVSVPRTTTVESSTADPADVAIAEAALLTPDQLGDGWVATGDGQLASDLFTFGAACADMTNLLVNTSGRPAASASRSLIASDRSTVREHVLVFDSEAAASAVLDRVGSTSFGSCINAASANHLILVVLSPPGSYRRHGDRQYQWLTEGMTSWDRLAFVQVGRAVMYVEVPHDFTPDEPELDAATQALQRAIGLVGPAEDADLARASLVDPAALGGGWEPFVEYPTHNPGSLAESMFALAMIDPAGITLPSGELVLPPPPCSAMRELGIEALERRTASAESTFVTTERDRNGRRELLGTVVWVFDSPGAASAAMDLLDSAAANECYLAAYPNNWYTGLQQTVDALSVGGLPDHGDRQILRGQQSTYTGALDTEERNFVNAWIQVGRAIAFIAPQTDEPGRPSSDGHVETALEAVAEALVEVFGSTGTSASTN